MSEKLKPCPFCGTTEHLFIENREERDPDYKSDHVVCRMCGAVHVKDDCLGWNNRPTERAAREEVLELAYNWIVHPKASITLGISPTKLVETRDYIRQAYQERFHEQG